MALDMTTVCIRLDQWAAEKQQAETGPDCVKTAAAFYRWSEGQKGRIRGSVTPPSKAPEGVSCAG